MGKADHPPFPPASDAHPTCSPFTCTGSPLKRRAEKPACPTTGPIFCDACAASKYNGCEACGALECDGGCAQTLRPTVLRYTCVACDFDLCAACALDGRAGGGQEAEAPAEEMEVEGEVGLEVEVEASEEE